MTLFFIEKKLLRIAISVKIYDEYIQLFKSGNNWKLINSVEFIDPLLSLAAQLPISVGDMMLDFNLPIYGGKNFKLSDYKEKNILLIFPRGWLGSIWCPVCHYQYLEMAEREKVQSIRKKFNLEIVYVLPYNAERVKNWFDSFDETIALINRSKNQTFNNPTSFQKEIMDFNKKTYPKNFDSAYAEQLKILPVLVDADAKLSKRLLLYTKYWDEVSSEQNIPTYFIIDKEGKVVFKYQSQITYDRPSTDYLLDFIGRINK